MASSSSVLTVLYLLNVFNPLCSYLVLGQRFLHGLGGGLDRSGVQNQLVQPAQQALQALLDADGLGHGRL